MPSAKSALEAVLTFSMAEDPRLRFLKRSLADNPLGTREAPTFRVRHQRLHDAEVKPRSVLISRGPPRASRNGHHQQQ